MTMASSTSKASTAPEEASTSTPTTQAPPCKFCKRPSECPTCHTSLDIPTTSNGTLDIDADITDTHCQLPPLDLATLPAPNPDFHNCMPPEPIVESKFSVFLAGSIEMGRAVQWQRHLTLLLQHLPISIYNPRRGHWNPLAIASARNAEFAAQVKWELNALEHATVIAFFFDHDTMSPVTMLELGLWAASGKVVVCCDEKFWKGGNVKLVCERYGIPMVGGFGELKGMITGMLRVKGMKVGRDGGLTEVESEEQPGWAEDKRTLVEAGWKEREVGAGKELRPL